MFRRSPAMLLAAAWLIQAQNAPDAARPDSAKPEAPKLARIEGHVFNALGGQPLRRVNIRLRPIDLPAGADESLERPYGATTDADGLFRIEGIAPGLYRLSGERNGFRDGVYGARTPGAMGMSLRLAAGAELKNLDFKLTPQAVISGRVVDEEGEPLPHVRIDLMRHVYREGRRQLESVGGANTDDNGNYRAAGLRPGRYVVAAMEHDYYRGDELRNQRLREQYILTYYPGVADRESARALDLTAGQEMRGIDLRLLKAPVYRVRGRLAGPLPDPRQTRVYLLRRQQTGGYLDYFAPFGGRIKPDGAFEIEGVPSGAYLLLVQPEGPRWVGGRLPLDVARDDLEGVVLNLVPAMNVTGRLRYEGPPPALLDGRPSAFSEMYAQLEAIGMQRFNSLGGSLKEDGSFTVERAVPGKYRFEIGNIPSGAWIRSIRAGDQDASDGVVDFSNGVVPLEVVLGTGTGIVTGAVQDAKQQPASGATVAIFQEPIRFHRHDLRNAVTADQSGQFRITGLPPGDYRIFAWDAPEPGSYWDPEVYGPHLAKSQRVSVRADGTQQVTLTQIGRE